MATMGSITRPQVVAVFAANGSVCTQGVSLPSDKKSLTMDNLYTDNGQSQAPERRDSWRIKRSAPRSNSSVRS